MVGSYLFRSSLRFYKQHPLQLLLSVLGIVLGVGIVTSVLITNSSSLRAFELSTQALYGQTTHHIVGALGVEQSDYVDFKKQWPTVKAAPVIEGYVTINQEVFSLIGLDPFAEWPFGRLNQSAMTGGNSRLSSTQLNNGQFDLNQLNTNGLFINQQTYSRLQLNTSDTVQLTTATAVTPTTVLGVFSSDNPLASEGLLIGDIGYVQNTLQRGTLIDRIDLILNDADIQLIHESLPPTLKLRDAASRNQTMRAMTRGFQINLMAMSLLSLVVGAFLIHNTMSFTVLQRREQFAIKRITGITSSTLFVSVIAEAVIISLLGSILGLLLGLVLSEKLIALTTQTINDLYFVLHVQQVWFSPSVIALGILLGVGGSVLAATASALEAAKTNPIQARQRSLIEQRTRSLLPLLSTIGLVVVLFGIAIATSPSSSLVFGFTALMLVIVGYALILPNISYRVSGWLMRKASSVSPTLSMALGGIQRNISRTGLAMAALTVAVSATFGVDVMIGSFRQSVDDWLGSTLVSDVYIAAPASVSSDTDGNLEPSIVSLISNPDYMESISTGLDLPVSSSIGNIDMLALQPHNNEPIGLTILSGNLDKAWQQFVENNAVLISEPSANKHGLAVNDEITIFTPTRGDQVFTVAGVVRDFASSHGKITMHKTTFNQFWQNEAIGTVGIIFKSSINKSDAINQLREQLKSTNQNLQITANTEIHKNSLAIFDRTFEVTRVLRWLTVGVAFIGIFSALLALNLERAREYSVLRATGATRSQLAVIILSQTIWMGVLSGLLALPLGWAMSEILIHVINLRSFGWSMQSSIPQGTVSSTLVLSCSAAFLAALYPVWKLNRMAIAGQLRDE